MYYIAIMNNQTKEIRFCYQDLDWTEGSFYWWTEGNMSCDCNREIQFRRAGNETIDIDELKCSEDRYTTLFALVENKVIWLIS